MSEDEKGATEEDKQKIEVIRGAEVLGYEGAGREEHSGENSRSAPTIRATSSRTTSRKTCGSGVHWK